MTLSSVAVIGARTMINRALADVLKKRGLTVVDALERGRSPDAVILTGGRSGGIAENLRAPYELMHENLEFATHAIRTAVEAGVGRLVFLSSSCVMTPLEPTSESYALAKLAGMKLCEAVQKQHARAYVSAIPATAYGLWDHFDASTGHVIPSLLSKFHAAKMQGHREVEVWGSGAAQRDFIFSEDLAEALLLVLHSFPGPGPIEISDGVGVSIAELAARVKDVVGFRGEIRFDPSKPEGSLKKTLDASRISELGWRPRTGLLQGLERTYHWALEAGVLSG